MSSDDDSSLMSSYDGLTMWPSSEANDRNQIRGNRCAHCTYLIRPDRITNGGEETAVDSATPSEETLNASKAASPRSKHHSEGVDSLRPDYGTVRVADDRRASAPAEFARYTPIRCENYHCRRCYDEEKDAGDEALELCGACLKAFLTVLLMAVWVFIVIVMVCAVLSR
jgi:hypothetical protein